MIFPHVGCGGGTLAPRNDRMPSTTMMMPTARNVYDTRAGTTLGSTSRQMMRRFFAPSTLAAVTKSRWE
jgi:hypothetical protein